MEWNVDGVRVVSGFSDANWAATRPLLQLVADLVPARAAAMMAWIDDYRDAFLRAHDTD